MMRKIEDVLKGEGLVFEGFLVKREKGLAIVQLHPGLNIELTEDSIASLEEATDPVAGRTYIKVVLKPDAEIRATFNSKLARLASHHVAATPFALLGLPQDDEPFVVLGDQVAEAPPGTGGGHWEDSITKVIGEKDTRSRNFWGTVNDDKKPYSGTQTDRRWVPD